MKEKQNAEGKILEDMFLDERARAQQLLDQCKKYEQTHVYVPICFGRYTIYFIPSGIDIERWKRKKKNEFEKDRSKFY